MNAPHPSNATRPLPVTVVALGGNSLLDPELPPTVDNQFAVTERAMVPVADLIERGVRVVITHGNGPQVGFLALRSELSSGVLHEVPLDSLVADTQGSIGYMIQRALREELHRRGLETPVVSLVTEVEVNPHDHAFEEPTKPIGSFHSEQEALELSAERGWVMVDDSHRGWRRVVPSPAPVRVVQLDSIKALIDTGAVVVCCGGGGIPVAVDEHGEVDGIEGVIDKDRVSALLAVRLKADRLIITTGTDGIYVDYLTEDRRRLDSATVQELEQLTNAGQFPPGSMGPKVKACCRFVEHSGNPATVCQPGQLVDAYEGRAGTLVQR